jgi:proteasome accessory factor C
MSAQARLTRILALVPWLLAHEGVTVGACAEHFGVTEDELQQDLWQLVVCGTPGYGPDQLVDIQFWDDDDAVRRDGVIRVLDPQTLDRPMRLTHQEALSLLVALRTLAQLPGIEDRGALVSAAAKLEAATAGADVEREVHVDVAVPEAIRVAVDAALAERRQLDITYASAARDEVTTRVIQPLRLQAVDGIAYLEALCLSAGAVRTFRLDRMLTAAVGAPIDDSLLGTGAGTRPGEPARGPEAVPTATLRLQPAARWVVDVHHGTLVEEDPESGVATVRLPLHSLDWGVRLVLSLTGAAVALEPSELADAVAAAAGTALASYPWAVT